jgi:hypothetical protein
VNLCHGNACSLEVSRQIIFTGLSTGNSRPTTAADSIKSRRLFVAGDFHFLRCSINKKSPLGGAGTERAREMESFPIV